MCRKNIIRQSDSSRLRDHHCLHTSGTVLKRHTRESLENTMSINSSGRMENAEPFSIGEDNEDEEGGDDGSADINCVDKKWGWASFMCASAAGGVIAAAGEVADNLILLVVRLRLVLGLPCCCWRRRRRRSSSSGALVLGRLLHISISSSMEAPLQEVETSWSGCMTLSDSTTRRKDAAPVVGGCRPTHTMRVLPWLSDSLNLCWFSQFMGASFCCNSWCSSV